MSQVLNIGLAALILLTLASSEDKQILEAGDRRLKPLRGLLHFQGKAFTGVTISRFETGVKKEMRRFVDGRRHGVQQRWFPSGQKLWENFYHKGQRRGHQFGWHLNGEKRFQTHYSSGLRDGEQWSWHPNGQLASYQLIRENEERVYKQWRPDGKIFTNYIRKHDEKFGIDGNEVCQTVQSTTLSRSSPPAPSGSMQE